MRLGDWFAVLDEELISLPRGLSVCDLIDESSSDEIASKEKTVSQAKNRSVDSMSRARTSALTSNDTLDPFNITLRNDKSALRNQDGLSKSSLKRNFNPACSSGSLRSVRDGQSVTPRSDDRPLTSSPVNPRARSRRLGGLCASAEKYHESSTSDCHQSRRNNDSKDLDSVTSSFNQGRRSVSVSETSGRSTPSALNSSFSSKSSGRNATSTPISGRSAPEPKRDASLNFRLRFGKTRGKNSDFASKKAAPSASIENSTLVSAPANTTSSDYRSKHKVTTKPTTNTFDYRYRKPERSNCEANEKTPTKRESSHYHRVESETSNPDRLDSVSEKGKPDSRRSEKSSFRSVPIAEGETKKCYISYIESPSFFFAQPTGAEEELDALAEQINRYVAEKTGSSLTVISPRKPCLAKYSQDGKWYDKGKTEGKG